MATPDPSATVASAVDLAGPRRRSPPSPQPRAARRERKASLSAAPRAHAMALFPYCQPFLKARSGRHRSPSDPTLPYPSAAAAPAPPPQGRQTGRCTPHTHPASIASSPPNPSKRSAAAGHEFGQHKHLRLLRRSAPRLRSSLGSAAIRASNSGQHCLELESNKKHLSRYLLTPVPSLMARRSIIRGVSSNLTLVQQQLLQLKVCRCTPA